MLGNLRRRARALLGAGVFSLALSGWPCAAAPVAAAGPLSAEQLHREAGKVELAWLADPTTYHLNLGVVVKGDALEVRGRVADPAARDRAVQVARQACYLPVHDAVCVGQEGGVRVSDHDLAQAVRTALLDQLGPRAVGLAIIVHHGKITLQGQVDTVERKLAAGRCLRGLPGARSVVNSLSVAGAPAEAAITVATAPPAATATPPAPPRVRHVSHVPYPLPPAPTTTLPSGLPPTKTVYVRIHPGKGPAAGTAVESVQYAAPPSGYALPAPPPPPPATPLAGSYPCAPTHAGKPACKPRLIERLLPFLYLNRDRCPAQPACAPAPVATPAALPSAPVVRAEPAPATAAVSRPLADAGAWRNRQSWPPAHHVGPKPPAPAVARTPEAAPVQPATARQAEPKPAAPAATAPAVPVVMAGKEPDPKALSKAVVQACGKLARTVKVERTPGGLVVHVHAPAAAAREITERVLNVPEIAAARVKLQMHLAD